MSAKTYMQSAEDFATPAGGWSRNPASNPLVRNNVRVAGNPEASRCLVFVHGGIAAIARFLGPPDR